MTPFVCAATNSNVALRSLRAIRATQRRQNEQSPSYTRVALRRNTVVKPVFLAGPFTLSVVPTGVSDLTRSIMQSRAALLVWAIRFVGSTAVGSNLGRIDKPGLSETVMRDAPTDIKLKRAEGVLEITWGDVAPRRYGAKQLRCHCGCAGCVDERTGVRTLDVGSVLDDIGITHIELVGNYALKLSFSDGHDTGIYTWDRLDRMKSVL